MGTNFSALIRYAGPIGHGLDVIRHLEEGAFDRDLSDVIACGLRKDFAFAQRVEPEPYWCSWQNFDERRHSIRPSLPSLKVGLLLPSQFLLTFGEDAIEVLHDLRWIFFLTDVEWQSTLTHALTLLCGAYGSRDCIITGDQNPAVAAFRNGSSFDTALNSAHRFGQGEVERIEDMYIDPGGDEGWDTRGYWPLRL